MRFESLGAASNATVLCHHPDWQRACQSHRGRGTGTDLGRCPVHPQSTAGCTGSCPVLGAVQYNDSLLLVDTCSCPVQPQSSTGCTGSCLVQPQSSTGCTGSCSVQPQSSTGGHSELSSTTTVYYWLDTGRCPVHPDCTTGGHWARLGMLIG